MLLSYSSFKPTFTLGGELIIEVWRRNLFGGAERLPAGLLMFLREGQAFATWGSRPPKFGTSKRLPVDDALAFWTVGAKRQPCPHVGKSPQYRVIGGEGYTCSEKTSGEDCNTVERCTICGFFRVSLGSPRFRAAMSGEHSPNTHPLTTYLECHQTTAEFSSADWDQTKCMLVPSTDTSPGRLIIWVHSGALPKTANVSFPNASVQHVDNRFTVLLDRPVYDQIEAAKHLH